MSLNMTFSRNILTEIFGPQKDFVYSCYDDQCDKLYNYGRNILGCVASKINQMLEQTPLIMDLHETHLLNDCLVSQIVLSLT